MVVSIRSSFSNICLECGGWEYVEDYRCGDRICTGCGIVWAEKLLDCEHEEQRNFSADHTTAGGSVSKSRTHQTDQLFNGSAVWNTKSAAQPSNQQVQNKTDNLTVPANNVPYFAKNLVSKIEKLRGLAVGLHLAEKPTQAAVEILKTVEKNRAARSKIDTPVLAACIFEGCRLTNPRTVKDILQVCGITQKEFTPALKRVRKLSVNFQPTLVETAQADVTPKLVSEQGRQTINVDKKILTATGKTSNDRVFAEIEKHYQKLGLAYSSICSLKAEVSALAASMEGKRPSTIAGVCFIRLAGVPLDSVCGVLKIARSTLQRASNSLPAS